MRLDLGIVEVFCSVYEERSFSRAATKLGLSQPTISGHIRNLEDDVGTKLFDRLPRQTIPTQAAKILYRRGRAILKEKAAAIQELDKFLDRVEGSLTACASTIPGEYLLPQIIASFYAKYPGVSFELQITDSDDVCQKVLSGKVEIGFVGARFEAVGLSFRPFASDMLALIVPNNKEWKRIRSITPDELVKKPLLSRESGSGTRAAFEKSIGRTLDEFNVVGSFGSTNSIKEAVKAGLGVSVLSLLAVKSEIARGELKTVQIKGAGPLRREFCIVLSTQLTTSPLADAFVGCVLEGAATSRRTA